MDGQGSLQKKRLANLEFILLKIINHQCYFVAAGNTDDSKWCDELLDVDKVMGHGSVNTTRIYTHTNAALIREAIERRNRLSAESEQQLEKMATKMATIQ